MNEPEKIDLRELSPLALEVLQALVVVHVAAGQDILQPGGVDAPHMSLHPHNGEIAVASLRLRLLVFCRQDGNGGDVLQAVVD